MEPYCYILKEKTGTFIKSFVTEKDLLQYLRPKLPSLVLSKYSAFSCCADGCENQIDLSKYMEPSELPDSEAQRWYNKQKDSDDVVEELGLGSNIDINLLTRTFTKEDLIKAYILRHCWTWK